MPKKGSQGEKKEAGRARAADVKKIDSMDELLTRVSFDTEEHDEALFSLEQGEDAPELSEPAATAAAEETSGPEKKALHKLTDKLRRKGAAADVFSADYRSLRAEKTPPSAPPEAEESTF